MSTLYTTRERLSNLEEQAGIEKLNNVVKQTYAFIDNGATTRADMLRHPYFKDVSLSTLKRAVEELLELELIKVIRIGNDGRKKYLITT